MRLTLGVVVAAALVLLVAVAAGGFYYTSSSQTCGTCHEMQTMYVSWQNSAHGSVACMACHSDPGIVGQVRAKIEGAKRLLSHFRGKFDIVRADVGNHICLECHADFKDNDKRVALADHPLIESFPVHQRHEELNLACTSCHARMVHGSLYKSVPVVAERCTACHEERGVLNPHGTLTKLLPRAPGLRRPATVR